MYELMEARASDPDHQDVPGNKTGLVAVSYVNINKTVYKEARFDSGLAKALLDVEKQAAIEKGEWVEKVKDVPWDGNFESLGLGLMAPSCLSP
jgi:hypothetical protein